MTQNKSQQIQQIENISSIFSDHKALKLETNPNKKNSKAYNCNWITIKIKNKNSKTLKLREIEQHAIKQWMG